MKLRTWWRINVAWIVVFIVGTIFIAIRQVDGAGVTQTTPMRLDAFAILTIFLIFIGLCQLILLRFVRKVK